MSLAQIMRTTEGVEQLTGQLDVDPKELWGNDLEVLCGPKEERIPWYKLNNKQRKAVIKRASYYIATDKDDRIKNKKYVTAFEMVNLVLEDANRTSCFKDVTYKEKGADGTDIVRTFSVQLPELVALGQEGMLQYGEKMMIPVHKIIKNNPIQRGVFWTHIIEDLLFEFRPEDVDPGKARYWESKDKYVINDGQHRLLACLIVGIRQFPMTWMESEFESTDVAQYDSCNNGSLAPSHYDKYRSAYNKVEAVLTEQPNKKLTEFKLIERNAYKLQKLFNRLGFIMEERLGGEVKPGRCQCPGNILDYCKEYDFEKVEAALTTYESVFADKAPISAGNIRMLAAYYDRLIRWVNDENGMDQIIDSIKANNTASRYMITDINNRTHVEERVWSNLEQFVIQGIKKRWNTRYGLWNEAQRTHNAYVEENKIMGIDVKHSAPAAVSLWVKMHCTDKEWPWPDFLYTINGTTYNLEDFMKHSPIIKSR